jgi:hypothetical protein
MTAARWTFLAGTAVLTLALSQGAAMAHTRHHHHYYHHRYLSAREATYYGRESAAAVEDSYGGPTLITSRPVPDTPFNRMRFGGPRSYGGRMTAPVGN